MTKTSTPETTSQTASQTTSESSVQTQPISIPDSISVNCTHLPLINLNVTVASRISELLEFDMNLRLERHLSQCHKEQYTQFALYTIACSICMIALWITAAYVCLVSTKPCSPCCILSISIVAGLIFIYRYWHLCKQIKLPEWKFGMNSETALTADMKARINETKDATQKSLRSLSRLSIEVWIIISVCLIIVLAVRHWA